ncbi:hypothetical protein [Ornithinibacillus xuwenensis]|uniref:Uncharacterized protein n=1 Tax=Ornithinibacillus xuwenensis TaxID=3144668 RepID=A0ABU9XC19_9BACI
MKLHQHFLPQDLKQASEEYWCVVDLLEVITKDIQKGDIELAKHRSTDLTRSLHEMSQLAHKKQIVDRHREIVKQMHHDAIQFQIMRSVYSDRKI